MIYTIVKTLEAGWPSEQERFKELGFKVGDRVRVIRIEVGRSSSKIRLEGYDNEYFNSVFFDDFEEDGKPLNIYKDERFNTYVHSIEDIKNFYNTRKFDC